MLVRTSSRGFTLIEMMIVLTIISIMLFYALPGYQQWMARARVRSVAESLQNSLRLAQATSVQRNRRVVFALTNNAPALNAVATANGRSWFSQALLIDPNEVAVVDRFIGGETIAGATGVTITGPDAICFNSVGRLAATPAVLTGVNAACALPVAVNNMVAYTLQIAPYSPLRVEVFLGGRIRMCDVAKTIAVDPDGCS